MPQSYDRAKAILDTFNGPDTMRAEAWDAYYQSASLEDLQARLDRIGLPTRIKSALWDAKAGNPEQAEHYVDTPEVEGGPVGRFLSNAWDTLNPMALIRAGAQLVNEPAATVGNIARAQIDQGRQAVDLARQGRLYEAGGHAGAAAMPIVGPAAAEAGEQIASGDYAGGAGRALGLVAPVALPRAVAAGARATRAVPGAMREGVATALERGAARRIKDTIAPVTGKNKANWNAVADRIAPKLADKQLAAWSREGYADAIESGFQDATAALDAATDAVSGSKMIRTRPIAEAIQGEIDALTTGGIKGDRFVPEPYQARAAALQTALDEVRKLGSVANYQAIRTLRQAWDKRAAQSKVYAQSASEFATKEGGEAAATAAGHMRESMAAAEPGVAAANAEWSLMKNARDVMAAKAEAEGARALQFPRTVARAGGAAAGAHTAGVPGAITAAFLSDAVEGLSRSGLTTKVQAARLMTRLAGAIRAGDATASASLAERLKRLVAGVQAGRAATSPNGFQTAPEPAPARQ